MCDRSGASELKMRSRKYSRNRKIWRPAAPELRISGTPLGLGGKASFPPILRLRRLFRLPLHVRRRVFPATLQSLLVIDDIPRTRAR